MGRNKLNPVEREPQLLKSNMCVEMHDKFSMLYSSNEPDSWAGTDMSRCYSLTKLIPHAGSNLDHGQLWH